MKYLEFCEIAIVSEVVQSMPKMLVAQKALSYVSSQRGERCGYFASAFRQLSNYQPQYFMFKSQWQQQ